MKAPISAVNRLHNAFDLLEEISGSLWDRLCDPDLDDAAQLYDEFAQRCSETAASARAALADLSLEAERALKTMGPAGPWTR